MVRQLREGKGQHGLVLGNGGVLTYQHVVCISSKPREDGAPYPSKDLLPKLLDELPVPVVDAQAEGACRIEVRPCDIVATVKVRSADPDRHTPSSSIAMAHLYAATSSDGLTATITASLPIMQIPRHWNN